MYNGGMTDSKLHRKLADGVWQIDVLHPAAGKTCCYLLTGGGEGALVDCGAKNGIPAILEAVAAAGLTPERLRWIVATHAHMDHAGAAGELLGHFPEAILAAHPSALRHLINPADKLEAAVRALYGGKFYDEHYGEIIPAAAERTHALEHDSEIRLGGRRLAMLHTPGHAWHHLIVYEKSERMFYAGDSYGTCFAKNKSGTPMPMPVMPPNQFDPEAMRDSLMRIKSLKAETAALSHFGTIADSPALADRQSEIIGEWMEASRRIFSEGGAANFADSFGGYLKKWHQAAAEAAGLPADSLQTAHAHDMMLNVKGFQHWLRAD